MLAMLRAIWLIATETAFVAYVAADRFAYSVHLTGWRGLRHRVDH